MYEIEWFVLKSFEIVEKNGLSKFHKRQSRLFRRLFISTSADKLERRLTLVTIRLVNVLGDFRRRNLKVDILQSTRFFVTSIYFSQQ